MVALDTYPGGALMIALFVLGSLLMMALVRRRVTKETLRSYHEVGGYYMSVVGTLYAVILGLVVVDSTNKFNEARDETIREANALTEVYAMAEQMPEPHRSHLKGALYRYAVRSVGAGWQEMEAYQLDEEEMRAFEEIIAVARQIEPFTENQKAIYPLLLSSLITASENRQGRLDFEHYTLPNVEWASLLLGAFATMAFTLFFTLDSLIAQALMTSLLALTLSLNLYIAFLFNTPYSGDLRVSRTPFLQSQSYMAEHP